MTPSSPRSTLGRMRLVRPAPPAIAATLLALACIAALWPGVATYDTVSQYTQATSASYDDWHPPVMARLWAVLLGAGLPGTGPMLALQWTLLWAGIGLVAAALARAGGGRAAWAVLAIPLMPVLASWMVCVLKDCQLIGALVAACGLVAWGRLARAHMPGWSVALVVVLLGYAALLRANAVFSVVPLALGWIEWGGVRRLWVRALLLGVACLAVIAVSGPIDHRLFGAERSDVERTLPLFDMAGIAHHAHLATLPGLPPAVWTDAEARRCYTPFFWDSLGDPTKCGTIASRLAFDRDDDAPSIGGQWIALIAHHPLAYLEHRLAHLNATLRIVAPADERLATGPATSLANPAGVGAPATRAAALLAPLAAWTAASPAGVPAVWLVLACGLFWTFAGAPLQPARTLGLALAGSGIVQTASFAVVSIASDLRYHLWLIVATLLAAAHLAACREVPGRRLRIALVATGAAALASVALRASVHGQLG